MSFTPDGHHLARWCVILAVVAGVLVLLTAMSHAPVTPVDSVVDAVRFVVAVAAAMGAAIMVIERRIVARVASGAADEGESSPAVIIDLRDQSPAAPAAAPSEATAAST